MGLGHLFSSVESFPALHECVTQGPSDNVSPSLRVLPDSVLQPTSTHFPQHTLVFSHFPQLSAHTRENDIIVSQIFSNSSWYFSLMLAQVEDAPLSDPNWENGLKPYPSRENNI
jgi:hypothetical protein